MKAKNEQPKPEFSYSDALVVYAYAEPSLWALADKWLDTLSENE